MIIDVFPDIILNYLTHHLKKERLEGDNFRFNGYKSKKLLQLLKYRQKIKRLPEVTSNKIPDQTRNRL
jgi:hypothetical protein